MPKNSKQPFSLGDGTKPATDEMELVIFGKGLGECILVHLTNDKWAVVDSLLDESRRPVALSYLESIGVAPEKIEYVFVTHWHDDHVKGIAQIYDAAPNAKVFVSQCVTRDEFFELIEAQKNHKERFSETETGVDEFGSMFYAVKDRAKTLEFASASKLLENVRIGTRPLKIWALSPADMEFGQTIAYFAKYLPKIKEGFKSIPRQDENDSAVVLGVTLDSVTFLLGSDLNHEIDQKRGWTAVISTAKKVELPSASVFKVPHHGSKNAHCDEVWKELLAAKPVSLLTPYNRGVAIPKDEDIKQMKTTSSQI